MREKSLFIDGFAPPSPPMATVLALLLETAATSVRRSKGKVAPFPLIYPPILARDPAPRTSLPGTTGMSVRLAHPLWCSPAAQHCPEPPVLALLPIYMFIPDDMQKRSEREPRISNESALNSRVAGADPDIMSDENPGLRVHFSSDVHETFDDLFVGGHAEVSPVPLPLPNALLHLPICLGSLFFPSRTPLTDRSLELSRGRWAGRPCPRRAGRSRGMHG